MKYKERLLFLFFLFSFFSFSIYAQDKPKLKLGGALRFNYNYSNWKSYNKDRIGDFGFDVFRLNVNGQYKSLTLNAEYRFYPTSSGGSMLKHGYVGYDFNENHQIQVGLTQVPFGIQPYTANSYFFNINYYVGLEDDADMGIKYLYNKGYWNFALAFFKNSDLLGFGNGEVSPDRYAYDVTGRNKETNQGNVLVNYKWGKTWKHQLGASAMYGGLYNLDTEEIGDRAALALHYVLDYQRWNLKAQYSYYKMSPKNAADQSDKFVSMGAYGASYNVASEASTYSLALSYTIPVNKGILDNICLYNDFSFMDKTYSQFNDSYQNITGCMLSMGPIYSYIDYAIGKNQAWLGGDWTTAFSEGPESEQWHTRFNINLGYYF